MSQAIPFLYADYPDPDVIRVGNRYYMISTTMHFFPGGQILRSEDLLHWEHCAYVFDRLDDLPEQDLEGGNIYGKGMWAASLRYAGGLFHALFVCNETRKNYYYTAAQAEGPWTRHDIPGFYHDNSMWLEEDGQAWVAYGNREIRLIPLTSDLSAPLPGYSERLIAADDTRGLGYEGSHLYRIDGRYYLFLINWPSGGLRTENCLRADSLTADFEKKVILCDDLGFHRKGVAQGGVVETPDHRWFAMLFQDHGAEGRMPVLIPLHWEDGWPVLEPEKAGEILPADPSECYRALFGSDSLRGQRLQWFWQWNHQPDDTLWRIDGEGLHLRTKKITESLEKTVNILTQRTFGPAPVTEVTVHGEGMKEGDFAGICALQGCYAALGLLRTESGFMLACERRIGEDHADAWHSPEPVLMETLFACGPLESLRLSYCFEDLKDVVSLSVKTDQGWKCVLRDHPLYYRLDHFTGVRTGLFFRSGRTPGGECIFTDFVYQI